MKIVFVIFVAHIILTSPHGYLMYLSLFPYRCDIGEGKFVSSYLALNPVNFDGTLSWPSQSTTEVSCISQDEPADKSTETSLINTTSLVFKDRLQEPAI